MIVCICRSLSDADLEQALQNNTPTCLLTMYLGNTICGACIPEIIKILSSHIEDEHIHQDD